MQVINRDGETFSFHRKHWSTPEVINVTGMKQVTLLSWRTKYGFLGGVKEKAANGGAGSGYRHSVLDVCIAALAKHLADAGMDGKDAAWCDNGFIRAHFTGLITKELMSNFLAVKLSGKGSDYYHLEVLNPVGMIAADVALVINLQTIIDHVFDKLGISTHQGDEND
jgi:hypothetical protein